MFCLVQGVFASEWWVGGNFGFNYSKVDDESLTTWYLEPEVGYNLDDDWDLGFNVIYEHDKGFLYEIPIEDKIDTYGIEPFVRYSLFFINDWTLYIKGSIFYRSSVYNEADISPDVYGGSIVPIVSYYINDDWSLSATLDFLSIDYLHAHCKDYDYDSFGININSGKVLSIGFNYHF